jgi:hypothetical protein
MALNTLVRVCVTVLGTHRALQRITVSPSRIGELAQAALVLTRIENVQLRTSC